MKVSASSHPVQILCIDDDPDVLEGLALALRSLGTIHVADSGEAALKVAAGLDQLAVVICDMRMPGHNGAEVLSWFRERHPEATRLLLTGYSDMQDAISAINQGKIFRFLSKPCDRETLHAAVQEALRQHRLVTAERELLEQTVKGCVAALVEALAIASPTTYGQAQRVRSLVQRVGRRALPEPIWPLEVAALLSNLGLVGVDQALQQKVLAGQAITPREQSELARAHKQTLTMLARIPRIEQVRDLVALLEPSAGESASVSGLPAKDLRQQTFLIEMVRRYVRLEASGLSPNKALEQLVADTGAETFAAALRHELGQGGGSEQVMDLPLSLLRGGMVLSREIRTNTGQLWAPAGYQIGEGFVNRLLAVRPDLKQETLCVLVPAALAEQLRQPAGD